MKKYLLLLLIPVLLFGMTACDKKETTKKNAQEKIVLEDSKLGFKTTFFYDKGENYSNLEVDKDSGASTAITFNNEDLDLDFQMYYNTMRTATYKDSQTARSKQKYYKEYKFGEYEAYVYGEYDSGLYMNILLKTEENDMADVLFVSIDRHDSDPDTIVSEVVAQKDVQKFFKSIKFEKIENNS